MIFDDSADEARWHARTGTTILLIINELTIGCTLLGEARRVLSCQRARMARAEVRDDTNARRHYFILLSSFRLQRYIAAMAQFRATARPHASALPIAGIRFISPARQKFTGITMIPVYYYASMPRRDLALARTPLRWRCSVARHDFRLTTT